MIQGAIGPVPRFSRSRRARLVTARGWTALAALSLVIAAGTAGFSVFAVYRLHVVLPIWDAWFMVADAQLVRAGTYGWTELTRQHNEHRLLFPRLLFLLDQAWFAMSDRDLLAEIFALQAVTAAALVRLGLRLCQDRRFGAILASFVIAVLFSLDQEQNLTSGFQVQFVGVFTAAVLGAVAHADGLDRLGTGALGGVARPGGWLRLALAGAACWVATFTMANGVLLGVVLVALALILHAPWRATLATLLCAGAPAAAFLYHYRLGSQSGSFADMLADPLAYAAFLLGYLGNPAGTDLAIAQVFGAAGLLGFGIAALRIATARRASAPAAALVAIMAFVVATACVTAFGRTQYGVFDALETRYVTPAAVFWCALVIFWFGEIPGHGVPIGRPARIGVSALGAVMVWLAANAVVQQAMEWPLMVDQAIASRQFRDSLWSGLYDLDASAYENNTDAEVRRWLPTLATERLSLFAAPEPRDRGQPIASLGPPAPAGTCTGTVSAASDPRLGPDGVRMSGLAWDEAANRPIRRILTTGSDGLLSGFGSLDNLVGRPRGWAGYATAAPGRTVEAYAVLRDGRLCRLGAAEVAAS